MALTRIVKGMIATGAVTPAAIESTSTFNFAKVSTPEIAGSGVAGLKVSSLRNSTSTYGIYYNEATTEITYGPAVTGGGGTAYNQSLNTFNEVAFERVTTPLGTFGLTNIANLRINGWGMPTNSGNNGQILTTNGSTATWTTPGVTGNQGVFTTSSVTFANITTTNLTVTSTATISRLVANGNTFPVGLGANGQYLKTNGEGVLSWAPIDFSTVTNQTLLTSSTVTFKTIKTETVEGTVGVGKDLYLQTGASGSIYMRDPTAVAVVVGVHGDIIPFTFNKTTYPRNLGSALRRWQNAWIETITVGKNTIIFEDEEAATTATLSISTGTVYVDGTAVVDQPVTSTSSPTFLTINGTTSTFEDIVVNSELFFSDTSVQTTAFRGNQALFTTSSVRFGAMTVTNSATVGALVFSADGIPINSRSELIGPQGAQGDPGQSSSLFDYTAKTNVYAGDPGTGNMLWNTSTQQLSTALHFNHIDNLGDDIEYLLGFHQVGDLIRIQDQANSENYQVWQISSPITVNTGTYVVMPVSLTTSTHSFANNDIVSVIFRSAGADQSLNTTSNVVFNSVQVSANVKFPDTTTQTTAWTGTVAYSNVTGTPTIPPIVTDQALYTTSSVSFASLAATTGTTVQKTVSAGGFPLNNNGLALITQNNTQSIALIVSNYSSGIRATLSVRSFGQNIPGGVSTTAGVGILNLEGSRGTGASPTATGSADTMGNINFSGYDGANWLTSQSTSGVANLPPASIFVSAAETFANNGSTTTNAGTNIFFRLQPVGTQLNSTSRRTWMASSWTAGSTVTNSPPILGMGIGQSTDATSPTLVPAGGVGSFGTGSGRTEFAWNAVRQFIQGVPVQDTAPDNATLTATNVITFISHRRSNVATRRNALQSGDTVGGLIFNAQTANSSSGNGSEVGNVVISMIEASGASARGTQFAVQTVNTGTTTLSTRMVLRDQFSLYNSDSHLFRDKTGSFTAATISTSTANFYGSVTVGNTWTLPATDGTAGQVLATNGTGTVAWANSGMTGVYARSALPTPAQGMIITISDSGSDTNSPAGNWAPAYWDEDSGFWTYIGNSNTVTEI